MQRSDPPQANFSTLSVQISKPNRDDAAAGITPVPHSTCTFHCQLSTGTKARVANQIWELKNKAKPRAKPTANPNDCSSVRQNLTLLTQWQNPEWLSGTGEPQSGMFSWWRCLMILIITLASKPLENPIPAAGVKTWHSAQNLMGYRWQEGKR